MIKKKILKSVGIQLIIYGGDISMIKSPCLGCELVGEDKNKCLENCEKLKQYQELILKEGIYAKI
jgi:hypothetical protein